jgi:general secretion pathway protein A
MFLRYYNLKEQPFGVTPDPRFLYLSPTHREALASLAYGIQARRGFMALIAPPGMGKTTLLFQVLRSVEKSARTVFIFQTQCTPHDFLRGLLNDLGAEDHGGDDVLRMQSKLNQILLQESRAGRSVIVIIDEAQNLETPVLEVLRMLSNFETANEKLMQIILAGQPQLADTLTRPDLVQLRQRVSIVSRLTPLGSKEVKEYIHHRLRTAGYAFESSLFTESALDLIAEHSQGIPRNVSNICFHCLSLGCALKQKTVGREIVREALRDLDLLPASSASMALGARPGELAHAERGAGRPGGGRIKPLVPRFIVAAILLIASCQPTFDVNENAKKSMSTMEAAHNEEEAVLSAAVTSPVRAASFSDIGTPPAMPSRQAKQNFVTRIAAEPRPIPPGGTAAEARGTQQIRAQTRANASLGCLTKLADPIRYRILEPSFWRTDADFGRPSETPILIFPGSKAPRTADSVGEQCSGGSPAKTEAP